MEDYTRHYTKVNVASVNFFGGVRFSKVRNWGREQTQTQEQERTEERQNTARPKEQEETREPQEQAGERTGKAPCCNKVLIGG